MKKTSKKNPSVLKIDKEWKRVVLYLLKGEKLYCDACKNEIKYDNRIIFYTDRYGEVKLALCDNCNE